MKVGVVCGGPSPEAEVSRVSGRAVADALRKTFPETLLIELDGGIVDALKGVNVVFPALHGPPGEDGCFQGLLEILGIPYVGCGVLASACAMDKTISKSIFVAHGLPTPRSVVVREGQDIADSIRHVVDSLGTSLVVKPSSQGSALGVLFAEGSGELSDALSEAFAYGPQILVEERVRGREITVAILERDGVEALPIIEVTTPPGTWYDYEHRYTPGLSEHIIPAQLSESQSRRIEEVAKLAYEALGCRDFSRVDFVVPDEGEPRVIEINTIPGMTPTSLFPDAARAAGISFEELVVHLVRRALRRGA
jgi:D-alanine-D-alanine ligase